MRAIDAACTLVILVMGLAHTALTPVFAPGLSVAALWFSGSGLAMIFLGLLNAARLWGRAHARRMRALCLAGNLAALAWGALVITVLPVPQAFLVLAAVLGVTAGSLRTGSTGPTAA
jgi:hypothetical protein